jgi:hypothetical protein
MFSSFYARLESISRRRVLAGLMILFTILGMIVFPSVSARLGELSGGTRMIDMETSYTPNQVFKMVATYGDQGRSLYLLTICTADLLFPLNYSLLFALLIIATYRRAFPHGRMVRLMYLAPFITAIFDLLENTGLVILLASYPQQWVLVAQIAGLFTTLKWAFMVITFVLVLIGFAGLIAVWLRK